MNRRYSKKRTHILTVLKTEHGALSVAEIHQKIPGINLTTIYRNLEMLVADGIVKKLLLNGKEATFEYQKQPHHHAICSDCERVIHFTAPDAKIKKLLGIENFEVNELEVTVKGRCRH